MQFHTAILLDQPRRKVNTLVSKEIQLAHIDIRRRQTFEGLRSRGGSVGIGVGTAWLAFAEQGRPAGDVIHVPPDGEMVDGFVHREVAVVEHGVDEDHLR